jgi:hypothetical protein
MNVKDIKVGDKVIIRDSVVAGLVNRSTVVEEINVVRGNTIATVIVDDKKYYYHPCLLELVKKEMKASPSDDAFWSDVYKTIQQKLK